MPIYSLKIPFIPPHQLNSSCLNNQNELNPIQNGKKEQQRRRRLTDLTFETLAKGGAIRDFPLLLLLENARRMAVAEEGRETLEGGGLRRARFRADPFTGTAIGGILTEIDRRKSELRMLLPPSAQHGYPEVREQSRGETEEMERWDTRRLREACGLVWLVAGWAVRRIVRSIFSH